MRATYFDNNPALDLLAKRWAPMDDLPDDIYRTHIQISELNALNACLAVIKYKQLRGFYADEDAFHQLLFTLEDFQCVKE